MINKVKEHTGLHYLLTDIWPCSLIFLELFPHKVLSKIKNKSITHNIFKVQDDESIMCGFYCIAFVEYMLAGKTLLDYTSLFYQNYYKKNDKISTLSMSILKTNMTEEASLDFRLEKIDETRKINKTQ